MEETKKEKNIWDLALHETLVVTEKIQSRNIPNTEEEKRYEVTRVPGGWVYAFEYIGFRQSPIVFVPMPSIEECSKDVKFLESLENKK